MRIFYVPKLNNNPKIGDIVVTLKTGKVGAIDDKNYQRLQKFIKTRHFEGESKNKPGNVIASKLNIDGIFTPKTYNSIKDKFQIKSIIGNKSPEKGDVLVYNPILEQFAAFSFDDWKEIEDSYELIGIQGIKTFEEEDASEGDYIIMANGHTLIIKPSDYPKVKNNWEHVDDISLNN